MKEVMILDFILFDLSDGNSAIRRCFMQHSNFAHKLNSQL